MSNTMPQQMSGLYSQVADHFFEVLQLAAVVVIGPELVGAVAIGIGLGLVANAAINYFKGPETVAVSPQDEAKAKFEADAKVKIEAERVKILAALVKTADPLGVTPNEADRIEARRKGVRDALPKELKLTDIEKAEIALAGVTDLLKAIAQLAAARTVTAQAIAAAEAG